MDTNPDALREKDQVWSVKGSHVYMQSLELCLTVTLILNLILNITNAKANLSLNVKYDPNP